MHLLLIASLASWPTALLLVGALVPIGILGLAFVAQCGGSDDLGDLDSLHLTHRPCPRCRREDHAAPDAGCLRCQGSRWVPISDR